jgi:hypothetical protein
MNLCEPLYEAFKIEFPVRTLGFMKVGQVMDVVKSHLVSFMRVIPFHLPNLFRGANKLFMLLSFELLFEKLLYSMLRVCVLQVPMWVSFLDSMFGLSPYG